MDELTDMLEELEGPVKALLLDAFKKWFHIFMLIDEIPGFLKEFLGEKFGHNLIAGFKRLGIDGPKKRLLVTSWTVKLFDLPADWDVPWPLEPPVL